MAKEVDLNTNGLAKYLGNISCPVQLYSNPISKNGKLKTPIDSTEMTSILIKFLFPKVFKICETKLQQFYHH